MNFIDPTTLQLVSRALDACALRHQVIAQNVANASVPGAAALTVRFEDLLGDVQAEMAAGRVPSQGDIPEPVVVPRAGGGAIALDDEMAALASNSLHYQALLKAMSRHLSILETATQEARR